MNFKTWMKFFDEENGHLAKDYRGNKLYRKVYDEAISIYEDGDYQGLDISEFLNSFHTFDVFTSVISELEEGVTTI